MNLQQIKINNYDAAVVLLILGMLLGLCLNGAV